MMAARNKGSWVWMDLEMTGLNPETCRIIQIATIITDEELQPLEKLEMVVWQPESILTTMEPFVRDMHTNNGLLEQVRASNHSNADAEARTLEMIIRHVPYRKGILAGNSIWQDRRFLLQYMPLLEKYLHYRMIDVSSLKVLTQQWYGAKAQPPSKPSTHTALEDIEASIEELRFYRKTCFRPEI
jgi:oligoribonuclease